MSIPSNINPLQNNGFLFSIRKLPDLTFFCQDVTLPDIQAPPAEIETPLVLTPLPGDKISFGDLSIQFLINENMTNYIAIHNWMIGLGFPQSHQQYQNFINVNTTSLNTTPLLSSYSDGTLQVLGSNNIMIQTITFVDLLPVGLSSLSLRSTDDTTSFLVGSATFRYSYYFFG